MDALAVTASYATVSEADAYLENNSEWQAATDEDKTDLLLEARYYIDTNFSCDLTEYTEVPEQLKYATSILAAEALVTSTIFDTTANIKREYTKADTVVSETEYFGGASTRPSKLGYVKGILKTLCRYNATTTFLLRG